jgi:hypothetical protein
MEISSSNRIRKAKAKIKYFPVYNNFWKKLKTLILLYIITQFPFFSSDKRCNRVDTISLPNELVKATCEKVKRHTKANLIQQAYNLLREKWKAKNTIINSYLNL